MPPRQSVPGSERRGEEIAKDAFLAAVINLCAVAA